MLESEAKVKMCPITSFRSSGSRRVCVASDCMMWSWETSEYDTLYGGRNHKESRYWTLEEELERNPTKPKDGWGERKDGLRGWQRENPQEQRHGSCGLANLNVFIE